MFTLSPVKQLEPLSVASLRAHNESFGNFMPGKNPYPNLRYVVLTFRQLLRKAQ